MDTTIGLGETGGGGVNGGEAQFGAVDPNVKSRSAQIKRELKAAKKMRGQWEELLDDAIEYTFPQKQGFKINTEGERKGVNIYDETGVVASQELVSRIQGGMFPAFSHWATAEPGLGVPEENEDEVRQELQIAVATTFEVLSQTNMSQELEEMLQDLIVSAGTIKAVPGDHRKPIRFQAVPMTKLYLRVDSYDKVDGWFEETMFTYADILLRWPNWKRPQKMLDKWEKIKDEKTCVIEAVRIDRNSPRLACDYDVFLKDHDMMIDNDKWYDWGCVPMITARWAKDTGTPYGRGPVLSVLGAIKTANLTVQLVLENADIAITGMWQAADDGVLNTETVSMHPGGIISIAPGSDGLVPLQPGSDFNISDLILQDMRHNIRRGLYAMDLGKVDKTPMSATEVVERQADLARNMGAGFARMHNELAIPLLTRCMRILHDQRIINMPVMEERAVKMRILSPLAYEQNMVELQRIDRTIELLSARFGPQVVNLMIKQDEVAEEYAKLNGMPDRFIRGEDEMRNLAGQIAQMSGNVPTPGPDQFSQEGSLPVDQLQSPGASGDASEGMVDDAGQGFDPE